MRGGLPILVAVLACCAACERNTQVLGGVPDDGGGAVDVATDAPEPQPEPVADTATGGDETAQPTDAQPTDAKPETKPPWDCRPCTPGECAAGFECATVGGVQYCLKSCTATSDCPGSYTCYPVTTSGKFCLPLSYQCVECASQGCDAGKSCDLVSGQCVPTLHPCGKCTYDVQCGDGSRCWKEPQAATGACVSECPDGTCADAHFHCAANPDGVKVCVPWEVAYCQPCPAGQVLLGDGVTCAECTTDAICMAKDASKPKCDLTSHLCFGNPCPTGKKKCMDGICRDCCVDTDCEPLGDGTVCGCKDGACVGCLSACLAAGTDCSANPDYPHCCTDSGTPQCCICATDADCAADFPGFSCSCFASNCVNNDTGGQCGLVGPPGDEPTAPDVADIAEPAPDLADESTDAGPTCGGHLSGTCEAASLSCQCCPAGGPSQNCLCSTPCKVDVDCTDPTRPVCNQSAPDQPGFCAPADFTCCWLCD